MADDKSGRDKQAHDVDKRQRERDLRTALERGDEPEPPVDEDVLDSLEADLEEVPFPATGSEVVDAVGDRTVATRAETYHIADLLPDADAERFEAPAEVRHRVERPTVAATMKRIVEAAARESERLAGSQRTAYEKTLTALAAVDADDDDAPVAALGEWVLDQLSDEGALPGSRAVRRQAAAHCRANGYPIRDDEWLGV